MTNVGYPLPTPKGHSTAILILPYDPHHVCVNYEKGSYTAINRSGIMYRELHMDEDDRVTENRYEFFRIWGTPPK